jgi:hypothetical protein
MATENSDLDFGAEGDFTPLGGFEITDFPQPNPFERLNPVFMGTLLFIPTSDELKSWCDGLIRSTIAVAFHDALVEAGCLQESAGFAASSSYDNFFNFMEMADRFAFYQKEGEAPAFFIYAGLAWIVSKAPPPEPEPDALVSIFEIDEEHRRLLRLNEPWAVRVLIGNGVTYFAKQIDPSVPVKLSTDRDLFCTENQALSLDDELVIDKIGQSFSFSHGRGLHLGELSYRDSVFAYSPRCTAADIFPDQISSEFQQLQSTTDSRLTTDRQVAVRDVLYDVCRHYGFVDHHSFETFAAACLVRQFVKSDNYHGAKRHQGLRQAVLRSLWDFKLGKKLESRTYIRRHIQKIDVDVLKMEVLSILFRHLYIAKKIEEAAEGNPQ